MHIFKFRVMVVVMLAALISACSNHPYGTITTEPFSRDLQLLGYHGWQMTLTLPANYRASEKLLWKIWYEVYEPGDVSATLIKSYEPDTWAQFATSVINRQLPIDILLKHDKKDGRNSWQFKAFLNMGGMSGEIREAKDKASSIGMQTFDTHVKEQREAIFIGKTTLGNPSPNDPHGTVDLKWYIVFKLADGTTP